MIHSKQAISVASGAGRSWHIRSYIGAAVTLLAGVIIGVAGVASSAEEQKSAEPGVDRPVIGIEHKGPIRVVFQISKDEIKDGKSKGLGYLKKLHEDYVAAGIDPDQLDIRAVYHGSAADHLLTDDA